MELFGPFAHKAVPPQEWDGIAAETARRGASGSTIVLHLPHMILDGTSVSASSSEWNVDFIDADGHVVDTFASDGSLMLRETFLVAASPVWTRAVRIEVYRIGAAGETVSVVEADGSVTTFGGEA